MYSNVQSVAKSGRFVQRPAGSESKASQCVSITHLSGFPPLRVNSGTGHAHLSCPESSKYRTSAWLRLGAKMTEARNHGRQSDYPCYKENCPTRCSSVLMARTYALDRHQRPESLPIQTKVSDDQFSATSCDYLPGWPIKCRSGSGGWRRYTFCPTVSLGELPRPHEQHPRQRRDSPRQSQ